MANLTTVLLVTLILIGATVGILTAVGVYSSKGRKKESLYGSYINPTPFKTGYIQNSPQKLADACRDPTLGGNNVMYPVNPPYVNYGTRAPGDCGECDVNIFNSIP